MCVLSASASLPVLEEASYVIVSISKQVLLKPGQTVETPQTFQSIFCQAHTLQHASLKCLYLLFVKYFHGEMLARLFVFNQHDSAKRTSA